MSNEELMPREKFNFIFSECMVVLKSYKFTPQTDVPQTNSRFSDIFEEICFGWFGGVTPKPKIPATPRRKTGLTQRHMDQMTLECALILAQQKVGDVHYNESLEHIRCAIAEILEKMGYKKPEDLCSAKPKWGCYKLWEEVARYDGVNNKEIEETRKHFKKNQPEHYEAT